MSLSSVKSPLICISFHSFKRIVYKKTYVKDGLVLQSKTTGYQWGPTICRDFTGHNAVGKSLVVGFSKRFSELYIIKLTYMISKIKT